MGIPLAIVKDDIKQDHPEWFGDDNEDEEDELDEQDQQDDRWGGGQPGAATL